MAMEGLSGSGAAALSLSVTDVSDRSLERSIRLNAGGILGIQAMTHYDWDAL